MPVIRRDDQTYLLASNASSTATGVNSGNGVNVPGGEYMFMAEGTVFTGAVVKFTTLPGNQSGIDLPAGLVRMAATGGTPAGLYAYLIGNG